MWYLDKILTRIPQVLSQVDREPFSVTYGCGDRVYWCWKFTDFPGARFQEYIYTLSWLYNANGFDNPWKDNGNILSLVEAGFNYWGKVQYKDGSFDEAYPGEHSLAATAFTVFYLSEGYMLLEKSLQPSVRNNFLRILDKAAAWLNVNDERHGILSNHLAAAAAGSYNAGLILGNDKYIERSWYFVNRIYSHQSEEGWFEEYGGADIGYQTHGSFYLARLWQKSGNSGLLESLKRANKFLSFFIHPDGSIGGEYASRNTMFYFPAAFEILYEKCPAAAVIADFQREKASKGEVVGIEQMDAHNLFPVLNNYIFAFENYLSRRSEKHPENLLPFKTKGEWEFPQAGLVVKSSDYFYAIIGGKKGGVIRIWDKLTNTLSFQSCGYVTQLSNKWYSNQTQGLSNYKFYNNKIKVEAPFAAINQKLFNPWLFIMFRLFTLTLGRIPSFSYWIKNLLVKVLVKRKLQATLMLFRLIQFSDDEIIIEDKLSSDSCKVSHIDKFSTIHMGSSRYIHQQEEQIRGGKYNKAKCIFDKNGILKKCEVKFL